MNGRNWGGGGEKTRLRILRKKKIFKTRTRETTVLILSPAFSRMVDMSVD